MTQRKTPLPQAISCPVARGRGYLGDNILQWQNGKEHPLANPLPKGKPKWSTDDVPLEMLALSVAFAMSLMVVPQKMSR